MFEPLSDPAEAGSNPADDWRELWLMAKRTKGMRHRLAVFSALFTFVLAFEYLLPERPASCIVLIPAPLPKFLIAMILAGGAIWFWFRLRTP